MKPRYNSKLVFFIKLLLIILVFFFFSCGGGSGDGESDGQAENPESIISNLSDALEEKNVTWAINFFDDSVQEKYIEILNLANDYLPEVAHELRTRQENGKTLVNYIELMKINNEWKIITF
jgi:hypothetical protein